MRPRERSSRCPRCKTLRVATQESRQRWHKLLAYRPSTRPQPQPCSQSRPKHVEEGHLIVDSTPCDECSAGRGIWKSCNRAPTETGKSLDVFSGRCPSCFCKFGSGTCFLITQSASSDPTSLSCTTRSTQKLTMPDAQATPSSALVRSASSDPASPSSTTRSTRKLTMFDPEAAGPAPKRLKMLEEIVVKNAPDPTETFKKKPLDLVKLKYPQLLPMLVEQRPSSFIGRLVSVPALRQLVDNSRRRRRRQQPSTAGTPVYSLRDLTAVICQVVGTEQSSPCGRCTNGFGPWKGCVRMSQAVPGPEDPLQGACANCSLSVHPRISMRAIQETSPLFPSRSHQTNASSHSPEV